MLTENPMILYSWEKHHMNNIKKCFPNPKHHFIINYLQFCGFLSQEFWVKK